ncbi:MAG TPA: glycosyltransferase [Candidatus Sulfotelmatobacter sp.]|nr:glycosyltransferase [Candidatus Sulfotelmatobacter sp.]
MPTLRYLTRRAYRCGLYEAEDVLTEIDDVELIGLGMTWGPWFKDFLVRKALYHDVSRKLIYVNPGLRRVRLTREYDLFIAICQNGSDLLYFNAIDGWRDHCKTSVCWIDEIWAASIPEYKYWLHALSRFDHIFVGCKGSVATLSNATNRSCHWLPGGIDTLRFSPFSNPPERVIDVYSIGRREERIHQTLLKAAGRGEIFYVYDTFPGNDTEVYDHRQHRDLYANVAKRSRYFVVAPGKMDDQVTRGQIEVGYRFYEGAAAGTVMIGQPPNCEAFSELFQWTDAVVPIRPDGSDVTEVLAMVGSERARVSAISRRNAVEALLHFDWVYRWKQMFRVAGIEPSPGMAARERRLKELADLAMNPTDCEASIIQGVKKP